MAGTPTPNYNWPLPALTDPPDGPGQMAALGNAIDATVKNIDTRSADTGWVTLTAVYQAGFAENVSAKGRRVGGICTVSLAVKRTGAIITAPASGDIGPDINMVQINDAVFQPKQSDWYPYMVASGGMGGLYPSTTGGVSMYRLATLTPGVSIPVNGIILATFSYAGI